MNTMNAWDNVIWDDGKPSEEQILTPHVKRAMGELYPGIPAGKVHNDPEMSQRVTDLSLMYADLENKSELPDATASGGGWDNVVWDDQQPQQSGGVLGYMTDTFRPVAKGAQKAWSMFSEGASQILPPRRTESPFEVAGRLGSAAANILGAIPAGVGEMFRSNVAKLPGGDVSPGTIPHPFREQPMQIPSAADVIGTVAETAAGVIPGRAVINKALPTRTPRFLDPADRAALPARVDPDPAIPSSSAMEGSALPPRGSVVPPSTYVTADPPVVEPPWKKLSSAEPSPPPPPGTLTHPVTPQSETLYQAQRTQVAPVSEAQKSLGGYGPPEPGFMQSAEQKLRKYPGTDFKHPTPPKASTPKPPKLSETDNVMFYANPFLSPGKVLGAAKSDPGRATLGAVAGYASGDNPEESLARAAMGAAAAYGIPKIRQTPQWRYIAQKYWRDPEEVVKNSPQGKAVIQKSYNARDLEDNLNLYFQDKMAAAYKLVGNKKPSIIKVNKALDDETGQLVGQLNSQERKAFTKAREVFNEIADALGLTPEQRITDYFPRLRLEAKNEVTKKIQVGEKGFYKTSLNTLAKREGNRWFLRERTSDAPADDLGLDPVRAYIRGASKKIAMEGGTDTRTGTKIKGFIHEIEDDLVKKVKDKKTGKEKTISTINDNDMIDYLTEHINQVVGVGDKADPLHSVTHKITGYQFMRTIGGNLLSPVVNLTQATLTFAHTNPKSFAAAYKDLWKLRHGDKQLGSLLEKAGIRGSLSKGDIAQLDKLGESAFDKAVDLSGRLFRGSESINRTHAFFAGYRDAVAHGLKGDAAIQYAKDIVNKTQFRVSKEALPLGWRSPTAGIFTQYKGFQLKYARRLKEMAVEDMDDISMSLSKVQQAYNSGDTVNALRSAREVITNIAGSRTFKFWGAGVGLFGAEAMTLGVLDKDKTKNLPAPVRTVIKGLLPHLGVYLGHQVGLGALPIEDLKSLAFSVPGPAGAMILDSASVAASLATGKDWDFSPQRIFDPQNGTRPVDAEKTLSRFIRLLPGGVQTDRVRRGLIQFRTEDGDEMVRRPETREQALGLSPVTSGNQPVGEVKGGSFLPKRITETARQTLGIQSPEKAREQRQMGEARDLEAEAKAVAQKAARVFSATNDPDKMMEILDEWNEKNGLDYPITPQMIKEAISSSVLPPRHKQFMRSPRALRPRIGETLDLFDDEE